MLGMDGLDGKWRLRSGQRLDGRFHGRKLAKDLVRACELNDHLYGSGCRRKHDVTFVRGYLPVQRENGSKTRRVQDTCIAEIQDEPPDPCFYLVLYDRLEGSCVTEVQRGADPYYHGIMGCRFDLEMRGCGVHDP